MLILRTRITLLALALFTAFSSLAAGQVLEQTFSDDIVGFKISTPNARWHFEPRGSAPGPQRAVVLFETALHQFVPNVTLRVTENLEEEDPETFFEKEQKGLPESAQMLTRKKISHRGIEGYELSWRDPASKVLFLQWFFAVKQRRYILTCSAKEASYARVLPDFRLILNSFQLL